VIVTPTMQRGARLSQLTVFLYLGELVELGPTSQAFMNPGEKRTLNDVTGRFG
jgi:phosphate transport system ATP-binding protein